MFLSSNITVSWLSKLQFRYPFIEKNGLICASKMFFLLSFCTAWATWFKNTIVETYHLLAFALHLSYQFIKLSMIQGIWRSQQNGFPEIHWKCSAFKSFFLWVGNINVLIIVEKMQRQESVSTIDEHEANTLNIQCDWAWLTSAS